MLKKMFNFQKDMQIEAEEQKLEETSNKWQI